MRYSRRASCLVALLLAAGGLLNPAAAQRPAWCTYKDHGGRFDPNALRPLPGLFPLTSLIGKYEIYAEGTGGKPRHHSAIGTLQVDSLGHALFYTGHKHPLRGPVRDAAWFAWEGGLDLSTDSLRVPATDYVPFERDSSQISVTFKGDTLGKTLNFEASDGRAFDLIFYVLQGDSSGFAGHWFYSEAMKPMIDPPQGFFCARPLPSVDAGS